jgi:hypothetical protein
MLTDAAERAPHTHPRWENFKLLSNLPPPLLFPSPLYLPIPSSCKALPSEAPWVAITATEHTLTPCIYLHIERAQNSHQNMNYTMHILYIVQIKMFKRSLQCLLVMYIVLYSTVRNSSQTLGQYTRTVHVL